MSKTLTKQIFSKLKNNSDSYLFIKKILEENEIYLFGGGVRDYLENNLVSARDLDFVIKSKCGKLINIEKYLNNVKFHKNRFNGYKIFFDNITIDIWDMEDTWAFKNELLESSVDNLLKSVYLNIDSLVYFLNEDKYINHCDRLYKRIKKLDIIYEETPFEELNLLRAIVYKNKYSLDFSEKLKKRFYFYITRESDLLNKFMKLQKEHYNNNILNKKQILIEIEKLKKEMNCTKI